MIRIIAAVDRRLGIANAEGIPWRGLLPSDVSYYRSRIAGTPVIMGRGVYEEFSRPYTDAVNYVATTHEQDHLRAGFTRVTDVINFLQGFQGDIWILGGAALYISTLNLADELYLTRIDADFHCTKFFPQFTNVFSLKSHNEPMTENNLRLYFEVWQRRITSL